MKGSIRMLVLTPIISPYRIPVFNELAKIEDIELRVLFFLDNDQRRRKWKVYSDEIAFDYDIFPSFKLSLGGRTFPLNAGVKRRLKTPPFDIAVCGGYDYLVSWQSLHHTRKMGRKFVLWIESNKRDRRPESSIRESLKRRFIKSCDGYLVPGKASSDYVKEFGVAEDKIFTAPNAVDNSYFEKLSRPVIAEKQKLKKDKGYPEFLLLFVGRMVEYKGIGDLIKAYEELDDRENVGLIFVGSGVDMEKYRAYCLSHGLKNVFFEGFIHREELPFYYGISDVFVFPSLFDPWGLVINEAMACGLPVIASHIPGAVDDLVHHGENGFIYKAGDVGEISALMETMKRNRELCARMGEESRKIISGYSPRHCAEGFAEMARAICRM